MQYIHRTLESVASGEYNSGEFFIKRPAGTGGNRKMGNKKRILLDIFCKTLDSDTLKIYISAQVSSFAHENQLKTRNFRPVCGEEGKMEKLTNNYHKKRFYHYFL